MLAKNIHKTHVSKGNLKLFKSQNQIAKFHCILISLICSCSPDWVWMNVLQQHLTGGKMEIMALLQQKVIMSGKCIICMLKI